MVERCGPLGGEPIWEPFAALPTDSDGRPHIYTATIAHMATMTARTGAQPAPDDIRPLYIRRPDAELARDARPVR